MKLKFGLRLKVWIHYQNGKRKKVIDRQSRSYLLAFIDNISGSWRNSAHTIPDINNVGRSHNLNNKLNADTGNTSMGIVIGNGFSDVVSANYALNAQMGHGIGAGQMAYAKQSWTSIDSGAPNIRFFELNRYFGNLYSLPQTIRECGIYVIGWAYYLCFVRDLLGTIEVPPRGGISINYIFEITI